MTEIERERDACMCMVGVYSCTTCISVIVYVKDHITKAVFLCLFIPHVANKIELLPLRGFWVIFHYLGFKGHFKHCDKYISAAESDLDLSSLRLVCLNTEIIAPNS